MSGYNSFGYGSGIVSSSSMSGSQLNFSGLREKDRDRDSERAILNSTNR